jgi:hypothetical protein
VGAGDCAGAPSISVTTVSIVTTSSSSETKNVSDETSSPKNSMASTTSKKKRHRTEENAIAPPRKVRYTKHTQFHIISCVQRTLTHSLLSAQDPRPDHHRHRKTH